MVETGREPVQLILRESAEESQKLIDRIAQSIVAGKSYFDVSKAPVSWETN
jgi:hypothetical protein